MAEEGTGGRGRRERGGRRKGPEREGEGRKREGLWPSLFHGPMTLWHGAPNVLIRPCLYAEVQSAELFLGARVSTCGEREFYCVISCGRLATRRRLTSFVAANTLTY